MKRLVIETRLDRHSLAVIVSHYTAAGIKPRSKSALVAKAIDDYANYLRSTEDIVLSEHDVNWIIDALHHDKIEHQPKKPLADIELLMAQKVLDDAFEHPEMYTTDLMPERRKEGKKLKQFLIDHPDRSNISLDEFRVR